MNTNEYKPLTIPQKIEILEAQIDVFLDTMGDSIDALVDVRDVLSVLRSEQETAVAEAFRKVYGEMIDGVDQAEYDEWRFENEPLTDHDLYSDFDQPIPDHDGQVIGQ